MSAPRMVTLTTRTTVPSALCSMVRAHDTSSPATVRVMPTSDDELDHAVNAAATQAGFSGAIRIDRAGHTLEWAFGFADRRWQIPFTPQTRASTASGTKGFTALVVMRLVEMGLLTLSTRARELLGDDLPLIDDAVTVEQLLSHRSGIGDYFDESVHTDVSSYVMTVPVQQLDTIEAYLAVLGGYPQRSAPGSVFAYNSSGFVVLALLAERAAGRSYHQLVDELVCQPAGLEGTGFTRSDSLAAGTATGYLDADGLRTNSLHLPVIGGGDGGLFSTVADIRLLWVGLNAGAIVSPDTLRQMTRPGPLDHGDADGGNGLSDDELYGLGFWLSRSGPAVRLEGYDAGVSFRSWHDPSNDLTHTVIGNTSDGAWPVTRVLRTALGPF